MRIFGEVQFDGHKKKSIIFSEAFKIVFIYCVKRIVWVLIENIEGQNHSPNIHAKALNGYSMSNFGIGA